MLSRKFIPFLLVVKTVVSQTVYTTTQVSYSTNAVPTVQTFPVSSATVTAVPAATTSITATAMPTTSAITATAMPAPTTVIATAMPATISSMSPRVTLASPTSPASVVACPIASATTPKITVSPIPSSLSSTKDPTEPKAYFLPANIPDPKVTILSNDLPTIVEVKPRTCIEDGHVEVKATVCPDRYSKPVVTRKDSGPMTAVKRVTMACTDDVPINLNQEPVCPGIPKMDIRPTPIVSKDLKSNPIDFEGLFDSFMTCL